MSHHQNAGKYQNLIISNKHKSGGQKKSLLEFFHKTINDLLEKYTLAKTP